MAELHYVESRRYSLLKTLWKFSRPHTITATTLQVLVCASFALGQVTETSLWIFLANALFMIFAGLGLNIYVVGINQLTDVSIDKVNKPDLPLAEGSLSSQAALGIIACGALFSLLAASYLGVHWALGIALILLLGTLYSCEPFRLKRHAVWSGLTIALCRGVFFNVAAFAAWRHLYPEAAGHAGVSYLTAFCSFAFAFVLAIGIFKDLPDFEGDASHRILTYAVRFGLKRSFWAGVVLLLVAYVFMIIFNFQNVAMQRNHFFLFFMLISLFVLLAATLRVRRYEKSEFVRFYRVIWALFYLGLGTFSLAAFT